MRFIGKFFLIAVVCLCAAVLSAPRELRAAEPDAEVKGLWLTAPAFPKDAQLVIFQQFREVEMGTYRRALDERLIFDIRRSNLGETKTPEEMKRAIEARVKENGGDKGGIEFDMGVEGFVEMLGYPCLTASYETNWGAWKETYLCVFTDDFTFEVILGVMSKYSDDYDRQTEDWFRSLKFVNAE